MSFKALSDAALGLVQSVLGSNIVYTPDGGTPVTIKGVFDNAYVDVEGIVSLKPTLRIVLSDLDAAPAKGDQVEIESVDYYVMESREDGFGGSTLILQKV